MSAWEMLLYVNMYTVFLPLCACMFAMDGHLPLKTLTIIIMLVYYYQRASEASELSYVGVQSRFPIYVYIYHPGA